MTGSHCVAQSGLGFAILPTQLPECWDWRLEPPCLVFLVVNLEFSGYKDLLHQIEYYCSCKTQHIVHLQIVEKWKAVFFFSLYIAGSIALL